MLVIINNEYTTKNNTSYKYSWNVRKRRIYVGITDAIHNCADILNTVNWHYHEKN